jgi:hypothetical protein
LQSDYVLYLGKLRDGKESKIFHSQKILILAFGTVAFHAKVIQFLRTKLAILLHDLA